MANVFISLHHNVTGEEPSLEHPTGIPFTYESGFKDYFAVFFYTLICIIMHAVLQEYVLDVSILTSFIGFPRIALLIWGRVPLAFVVTCWQIINRLEIFWDIETTCLESFCADFSNNFLNYVSEQLLHMLLVEILELVYLICYRFIWELLG